LVSTTLRPLACSATSLHDALPISKLVVHITEPTAVKLEGTLSLTVKVAPGASPVKLPVRVTVVPGPLPPTSTVEPLVPPLPVSEDGKRTRPHSSHVSISYAALSLK